MEQIKSFLIFLQEKFKKDEAKQILSSLSRERALWGSILTPGFADRMHECYGSDLTYWNPARLAMYMVFLQDNQEQTDPVQIRDKVEELLKTYQALKGGITKSLKQDDLATALKIAYLVRYQFDEVKNYQFLSFLSLRTSNTKEKEISPIWHVAFSILDSIVENPDEIYYALLNNLPTNNAIQLIIHAILTQPLSADEKMARFLSVIKGLPVNVIHPVLRELTLHSTTFDIKGLAEIALPVQTKTILEIQDVDSDVPEEQLINIALEQQIRAKNYLFHGNEDDSIACLSKSKRTLKRVINSIDMQMACIDGIQPEVSDDEDQQDILESILIEPNAAELEELLTKNCELANFPLYWLKLIQVEDTKDNSEKFNYFAKKLLASVQSKIEQDVIVPSLGIVFDYDELQINALEILIENDQFEIAMNIGGLLYKQQNYSSVLLDFLYSNFFSHKKIEEAKTYAELYHTLNPDDLPVQIVLGKIAHDREDWIAAYQYNKSVISQNEKPTLEEWLMMAKSALKVDEAAVTVECCNKVLTKGYECAEAHTLLGKAYQNLDEMEKAIAEYDKAIEIDSKDNVAWQALADFYKTTNRMKMARGVLTEALKNLPDDPALNESLADLYFSSGDMEKATLYYSAAIKSSHHQISAAEKLCNCLWEAQNYSDIEDLLNVHEDEWGGSKKISFIRAKILLFKNDINNGLDALEYSLDFEKPDEARFRLYIDTIVEEMGGSLLMIDGDGLGARNAQFAKAIYAGVVLSPDDFALRLIYAEHQLLQKQWVEAKEEFESLTNYYEANLPLWKWRVQAGMGISALSLGLPNIAMAALQSAANVNNKKIEIYLLLAEATYQAKLEPQALIIAEKICTRARAENNAKALNWYVNFLSKCGESSLAMEKLHEFIGENPDQKIFYIIALEMAFADGDFTEAKRYLTLLEGFEDHNQEELGKLAFYYECLGDYCNAEECLSKAEKASDHVFSYRLKRYRLCMLQQDYLKAYELIAYQEDKQYHVLLQVLKADALMFAESFDSAMDILKTTIEEPGNWQMIDNQISDASEELELPISKEELIFHQSPESVYLRLSLLNRLMGNLQEAQSAAEKALAFGRNNPICRYFFYITVKLLKNPKQLNQLQKMMKSWFFESKSNKVNETSFLSSFEQILRAIRIESYLSSGNRISQSKGYDLLDQSKEQGPRFRMLHARKAFLDGEYKRADELYQVSLDSINQNQGFTPDDSFCSIFHWIKQDDDWLIEGQLSLNHSEEAWDSALKRYKEKPEELNRVLTLLSTGSSVLFQDEFYSKIGVTGHLPSNQLSNVAVRTVLMSLLDDLDMETMTDEERMIYLFLSKMLHDDVDLSSIQFLQLQNPEIMKMALQLSRSHGLLVNWEDVEPRIDLDNRTLLQQAALSLIESDPKRGLFYIKRALGIMPSDPVSRIIYAMLAEVNGDDEGTLQAIETALSVWSKEWNWHEWAALVAKRLNDSVSEIAHLEILYKQFPDDYNGLLNLAESFLDMGSYRKASTLLLRAQNFENDEFVNRLNSLFAITHFQSKSIDTGLEYLARVNCEDESSVGAYLAGAEVFITQNSYEKALKLAQVAYGYNPRHSKTLLLLGKILFNEGHAADAESLLRQIDKNSSPKVLVEYLKLIKELSGNEVYHQELFETAHRYEENPELLFMKAEEFQSIKEYQNAIEKVKKAIQTDPSLAKYQTLAGSICNDLGQLDQAVFYYSEAIRLDSRNTDLYLELAKIQATQREIGKALGTYRLGIQNSSDDYRPYYEAALLLRDNKQYSDAEYMFKQALDLQSNNEEIRNQLGAVMALNFVHSPQELRH
ncbi:MAG: tetratricopeptide repeat protein [Anaerolineaceae bacterium]|nr:tetratricopeptide repeat protein [Anaerolineaceae bacterium]